MYGLVVDGSVGLHVSCAAGIERRKDAGDWFREPQAVPRSYGMCREDSVEAFAQIKLYPNQVGVVGVCPGEGAMPPRVHVVRRAFGKAPA